MLEYRDNYKYSSADRQDIDGELEQLYHAIKDNRADSYSLYKQIRHYIYKQIKIDELAITKILNDLIQIRSESEVSYIVIMFFVANPLLSYSEIGQEFDISKQRVYSIIKEYADKYVWLSNLLKIKGYEDSKNENNRSIQFTHKPIKKCNKFYNPYEQMELFQ